MPNIIKVLETKKPFIKIEYRAWNFSSTTKDSSIEQYENQYNNTVTNNTRIGELENKNSAFIDTNKKLDNAIKYNKINSLAGQKQPVSSPLAGQKQPVSSPLAGQKQPVSSPLAGQKQPVSSPLATALAKTDEVSIILPAGKELDLLLFLCDICIKECSLKTTEITTKVLNDYLGVNSNRLRNIVSRVVKKGLIKVISKNCSTTGAYRIFAFSRDVYDRLLLKLTNSKLPLQTEQALAGALAERHVCSSYNINTTYPQENFQQIDYSPLEDYGFDESHIIQIYREYTKNPELALSSEIIQNSINALAFDLKHNNVAVSFKNSPTVVLTALLKKGQPYSSKTPEKVLSPREEAMQEYLAAQQKRNSKILEIENQAKDCTMQEWLTNLPDEELLAFNPNSDQRPDGMPEKLFEISRRKKALVTAKEYFDTVIWPSKYKQILDQDKQ